ncbi:alpha/beta fold hydrolase [Curtobacterium aetherium]|uniref:Alpha/beta fold hydrolase n=1 Tax=Curtobacterium aetherium TaxID=2841594 RepID=A0ACD1E2Q9_9MICO|nr:alpha/beta hydrolase [Curtobacterium sp. L6-1]QWS33165.1 alpha/beta fold hydrolase [Curtobacterium sp. L6-1]
MRLHADTQGAGRRTAVLLHGMTGSSESWWRITPLLAARGFRVLALDLPGHGRSPRDPELSVERAAQAVAETVDAVVPGRPAVVVGHSIGGTIAAAAVASGWLDPELAVYVDAPVRLRGGADRATAVEEYATERLQRTVEVLRASKPHYSDRDCVVEARAAVHFDPVTAGALAAAPGGTWTPRPGSIVVRADPSHHVDADTAAALVEDGVTVRSIAGAAHAVWYSHPDAFVSALPELFG